MLGRLRSPNTVAATSRRRGPPTTWPASGARRSQLLPLAAEETPERIRSPLEALSGLQLARGAELMRPTCVLTADKLICTITAKSSVKFIFGGIKINKAAGSGCSPASQTLLCGPRKGKR